MIYSLFVGTLCLLQVCECKGVAFGGEYGLDFCKGRCSEV